MLYAVGTQNISVDVQIVDDNGLPVSALVAASFPATSYSRNANVAATAIVLSNLAAITDAWASGGVITRSGGYYRLDLPNAVSAFSGEITLLGEASGKHLIAPRIIFGGVTATSGFGTGANIINQNQGGTNNLQPSIGNVPQPNVTIRAYLQSDFAAGRVAQAYVKDQTITDSNGNWTTTMSLASGVYAFTYNDNRDIYPPSQNVTVP